MTTYYVGPGGNDGNSGRTWGTRLATLNGAEDKPVVAGDTVYVAPGVYRELLTCDVSGAAGSYITYIADETGEHTDGVGGPVRITGSDNDQTTARANCIAANARDYRIFRGFDFDFTSSHNISLTNVDHWWIEDCTFQAKARSIFSTGTSTDINISRCFFLICPGDFGVYFFNGATVDDAGHDIENCIFIALHTGTSIRTDRVGGITVRNCTCLGGNDIVRVGIALSVGQTVTVNNCIFHSANVALRATVLGEIVEDYNTFYANSTDRTNVAVGANSVTYPPLFRMPLLHAGHSQMSGFRLPWWFGELSRWSQVRERTGSNEADEDFFGIRRPFTHGGPIGSLCSWGAVQHFDVLRSDAQAYEGSLSALVREGDSAWMFVPGVSAVSTTISVRSYRTAGYGSHRNPTMTIKQSGRADRVTIAGGAAGAWY